MKEWKKWCAGLAGWIGLTAGAWGQVPAAPAAGAAVAGDPAAMAAAAAAAPPPANLWSFFCMTPLQKDACKQKLCATPIGQMLNNSLKPVSVFSGGLLPECCPLVNTMDLLKPADSAEGAAARIKADEAAAKARRAAVRYLGTVDCRYWPEAQDALVNALRTDRNECVRLEAALALLRGCCCTRKTLDALSIVVSGSERDGFPAEKSHRVKEVATMALDHCLACLGGEPLPLTPLPPVQPKTDKDRLRETRPPESPAQPKKGKPGEGDNITSAAPAYSPVQLPARPPAAGAAEARQTLAQATAAPPVVRGRPRGEGGLFGLIGQAIRPRPVGQEPPRSPIAQPTPDEMTQAGFPTVTPLPDGRQRLP
jgi:hypothetical protein